MLAKQARAALVAAALGDADGAAGAAAALAVALDAWLAPAGATATSGGGDAGGGDDERTARYGPPVTWVYDLAWGGLVACGCEYVDLGGGDGACANAAAARRGGGGDGNTVDAAHCPAFADPGHNFGAGWYDDDPSPRLCSCENVCVRMYA